MWIYILALLFNTPSNHPWRPRQTAMCRGFRYPQRLSQRPSPSLTPPSYSVRYVRRYCDALRQHGGVLLFMTPIASLALFLAVWDKSAVTPLATGPASVRVRFVNTPDGTDVVTTAKSGVRRHFPWFLVSRAALKCSYLLS